MKADDDERTKLAEWFKGAIKDARGGNREMADSLLRDFAHLATNPGAYDSVGGVPTELIQYVATCIADWRQRGYRDAELYFYVDRPHHRPPAAVSEAQICALREYMVLRALGHGIQAAISGAKDCSGLTESQVRYVIESHPELDTMKAAVMLTVTPEMRAKLKKPPPRKKDQRRV